VLPPGDGAQDLRIKVIREHHDIPMAGHMGTARTIKGCDAQFPLEGNV
jgi:hypothetical protein